MELKIFFQDHSKIFINWLGIWIQVPYFDRKNIPHSLCKCITTSELGGFGIGYSIDRKYRQIRVSVSVLDRNQNSGFGRSLGPNVSILLFPIGPFQMWFSLRNSWNKQDFFIKLVHKVHLHNNIYGWMHVICRFGSN